MRRSNYGYDRQCVPLSVDPLRLLLAVHLLLIPSCSHPFTQTAEHHRNAYEDGARDVEAYFQEGHWAHKHIEEERCM